METFSTTLVNITDYEFFETLGTGTFSRVRLGRNKKSGEFVAIKIFKKAEIIRLKQVDHVINENKILENITHPFITKMLGSTQDNRLLYIILEFIQGGELFTYLRKFEKLTNNEACFYAAQITSIFEYLHSKNIVYRDLKPENILICEDGYIKLTDFGFAKYIDNRTYTLCGTPQYLAPEIILNKGHGKSVDWWCLGILIYEMLAGIDPFNDDDPLKIYKKILQGRLIFPETFDKNAKSLIKRLLVADINQRFGNLRGGAKDIKRHRWFNGINWDDLLNKKIPAVYYPPIIWRGDTSNYLEYPDSNEPTPKALEIDEDPFASW